MEHDHGSHLMANGSSGSGRHHEYDGPIRSKEEFLNAHPPGPPSYIGHDFWPMPEDEASRWPSLMMLHIVALSLSFFVFLPLSISLRAVNHKWHGPMWVAFHISMSVGLFSATLYNKLTPDFYEGSKHARMGYSMVVLVTGLWLADCLAFIRGLRETLARDPPKRWSLEEIKRLVFGARELAGDRGEYAHLVQPEDEEEEIKLEAHPGITLPVQPQQDSQAHRPPQVSIPQSHSHTRSVSFSVSDELEAGELEQWRRHGSPYGSPGSNNSDLTLNDAGATPTTPKKPHPFPLPESISWRGRLRQAPHVLFHTLEYALVPFAFATCLDGAVTYTGICHDYEVNLCLAHFIKGGIFFCYGLLNFARYLGAWRSLGWSWNRATSRNAISAEMVENLVIFLYGASNTWMERFDAETGDPYTTRQIQHISIAVMFWFAGTIGMALESRTLRRWLSGSTASGNDATQDPPSFNPIPGLVVAVTGLAMSRHNQETQFLVDVHVLWGMLLTIFAVMRWITYFLLWVKNKTGRAMSTTEPGRPPSEVLAAFCLSCGGISFILSMEPIGIEAVRAGHDDMMMFMNFAVSLTCFAFLWMLGIMAFNGYVKTRAAAGVVRRAELAPRRSQSL